MQRAAGFALLYFIIAWAFHAGTINLSTQLIGGGDAFIQGLPSKLFSTSLSPWNSYVQGGKYVYADVLYQSFYPPNLIIFSFLPNTLGFNLYLLVHYAFAGLFTYLYLSSLRLATYSAFIGGLMFMVCGFMCSHKGHEYIICSAIWLPLVLFFVDRCVERLQILSIAWAAVPSSLSILAGFPQITLYGSALILAYLAIRTFHSVKLRGWTAKLRYVICGGFILFFLAGLLGSLPILAVAETLPYLTREHLTYEMFTSDSFPPWQSLTFLIPNLFGGVDRHVPMYGPATTVFAAEVYPYMGLLPMAFAIGCCVVRLSIGFQAKFWIGVALVGLLLAFGGTTPIYHLLFHIPIYNLFRVPSRHLFEVDLALCVLAALGLDYFLRRSEPLSENDRHAEALAEPKHKPAYPQRIELTTESGERARRPSYVRTTLIILSLIFVSSLLLARMFRSCAVGYLSHAFPIPNSVVLNYYYHLGDVRHLIAGNLSWQSFTMLSPLFFFATTLVIVLLTQNTSNRRALHIAIPLVVLADSYLASHRMYDNPSTDSLFSRSSRPELDFLESKNFDKSHFRIFPVDFDLGATARLTSTYHLLKTYPYPLINMFDGLSVINDYGPFWLKRYQAVTGFGAGGRMPAQKLQNQKILSVLGARFLMVLSPESKRLIEAAKTESGTDSIAPSFSPAGTTPNGITIYENSRALPRFRFVKRIIAARDLEDALFIMSNQRIDPAYDAIVENIESEENLAPGKIVTEQIENTRLSLDIETGGHGFLIVADSFFPGWTASVDGKATRVFPAYGCVRGISIETAGKHHVEFRFFPKTLFAGLVSTTLGILLLVMLRFVHRTGSAARCPETSNSEVRRFHR
jgi:hypothetical protein